LVDFYDIPPDVVATHSRFKLREVNSFAELEFTLAYPSAANNARH
jgi:hypothetical protein